jgi:hypothetical protein
LRYASGPESLEAVGSGRVQVGEDVEEDVVRTVSENATALKFDHASFEKD